MSKKINLVGQRFGKLTVIEEYGRTQAQTVLWKCICDCGNETIVRGTCLRNGHTTSCGCNKSKATIERNYKHGESNTRLYNIWRKMLRRVNDPRVVNYKYYGGRGIKVCDEWYDYVNFSKWAKENGYNNNLSIERMNVNDNYCPANCKWIPISQQSKNKRNNIYLMYDGELRTVAECSRISGINYHTLITRIKSGFDESRLFEQVKHKKETI